MEEESKHAVPDTPLERRQLVHIIDASPAEGRSVGLFPVREHAAVLLEDPNKLYMIGGSRHKARTNQFWVLDMGTQVVSLFVGAHLPPRHSCMAKVDAWRIYARYYGALLLRVWEWYSLVWGLDRILLEYHIYAKHWYIIYLFSAHLALLPTYPT